MVSEMYYGCGSAAHNKPKQWRTNMKEDKLDTPDIELEKTEHGWKLRIQLSPVEWFLILIVACVYISVELL
jgi:hypothetical protein